eukprot:m.358641 g.358641  ORF g.358641 m.358641 type:complete len:659 (+) comp28034_c0_seq1:5089-7065(+)
MGWVIRVRCPKGEVKKLTFASGGGTTLAELRAAAATDAKIAPRRLLATSGRPPALVLSVPAVASEGEVTLESSGLQHGDMLFLRRHVPEEASVAAVGDGTAAAGAAAAATSTRKAAAASKAKPATKSKSKGKGKAKMGQGHTLGSTSSEPAPIPPPPTATAPPTEIDAKKRPAASHNNGGVASLGGPKKRHKWGAGRSMEAPEPESGGVAGEAAAAVPPPVVPATPEVWMAEGCGPPVFAADNASALAQLDAESRGVLTTWDLAIDGVFRHALLAVTKSGDREGEAEEATVDHCPPLDMYYAMLAEVVYAFQAEPEKANGECDLEWVKAVLADNDYHFEDNDADDELGAAYDEAVDLYAEVEVSVLATELCQSPDNLDTFDVAWIRQTLGYTVPEDNPDEAVEVWKKMWEDAKLARDVVIAEVGEAAAAGVGDEAAAGASVGDEAEADSTPIAVHVQDKAKTLLGFDFAAVLQDSLIEGGEDGDAIGAVEQSLGVGLVEAVGAGGNNATKQMFQGALKSHESKIHAEKKVQAALAGQVSFAVNAVQNLIGIGEEYITVKYKVDRSWHEETVKLIPSLMVVGILYDMIERGVEDELDKLLPSQMALHSSRVFWNVVRYGNVGPHKTFEQACAELVPEVDWGPVFARRKRLKYDSLEWAM